jgi:quercetin dioxygenase-like cupin family protein
LDYVRSIDFDRLEADGRQRQSLLDDQSGATSCAVSCVKTPPGDGSPEGLHTHAVDQLFYIIRGTMNIQVNEARYQAGPGTLVVFPAGVPHRNWNDGIEATIHLNVATPLPDPAMPFATRVDGPGK